MGPTWENHTLQPLGVQGLDNRLYTLNEEGSNISSIKNYSQNGRERERERDKVFGDANIKKSVWG